MPVPVNTGLAGPSNVDKGTVDSPLASIFSRF